MPAERRAVRQAVSPVLCLRRMAFISRESELNRAMSKACYGQQCHTPIGNGRCSASDLEVADTADFPVNACQAKGRAVLAPEFVTFPVFAWAQVFEIV